ncbi:hypothetical protein UlMin_027275 [Ulmus minor]
MEMEPEKLFIGGISWYTIEDRLRDYFRSFGDNVEAMIMKDQTSGRACGFEFIVFADPAIAERVVIEKHMIDARIAKKAIPKDDQNILNRNSSSTQGLHGPTQTKKIFVGGARRFGLVTYDLEDVVVKLLFKIFHGLNGKIVEVKRVVPKELSPGSSQSQLTVYNYGLVGLVASLIVYSQGYNVYSH